MRQAEAEHGYNGGHQQQAANLALLDEMAWAGDEPRQCRGAMVMEVTGAAGPAGTEFCLWVLPLNEHQFALYFTCHLCRAVMDHHVDLAAHAELRQIDARLHGEARTWG